MKVCDRCKKELDNDNTSSLNGEKFELCSSCSNYISKHIREFKGEKGVMGKMFS